MDWRSNLPVTSNLLVFASFIQKCLQNIKQRISRHFIYKNIGKILVKWGWNYRIIWLHQSCSLILSWWYPDLKSILKNTLAPFNWSNRSSIRGNGYFFFIITLFYLADDNLYTAEMCHPFSSQITSGLPKTSWLVV
jgi:hypothetical protein